MIMNVVIVVKGLLLVAVPTFIIIFIVQRQNQQQQPPPLPLPRLILFDTKVKKKTNRTIWKYLGTQDDITQEYKDYILDKTKTFIQLEEQEKNMMKKTAKTKKKKQQEEISSIDKLIHQIPNYYYGNPDYVDLFEWKFSNKRYRIYNTYDDDDDVDDDADENENEYKNECIFSSSSNVELPNFHFLGSCNDIHQIDIVPSSSNSNSIQAYYPDEDHFKYIHSGGQRSVFKIYIPPSTINDSSQSYFAMKMNRYDKSYKMKRYDDNIYDSNVMSELTSSKYVANIYSSCGLSQITEYSKYGNLYTVINKSRRKSDYDAPLLLSSLQKLKIAYQLSKSVTDMQRHGISHLDIGIHQYLYFDYDGIYKLNDFGQGKYMMIPNKQQQQQHRHVAKKKKKTQLLLLEEEEDDDDHNHHHHHQQQTDDNDDDDVVITTSSPPEYFCHTTDYIYNSEQFKYYPPELIMAEKKYNDNNDKHDDNVMFLDISKIDTYMMSTAIYSVLTNLWMYEGKTQQQVLRKMMKKGKTGPAFPTTTTTTTSAAAAAAQKPDDEEKEAIEIILMKAIRAGLNMDPMKRSTAKEISDYLYHSIQKLEEKKKKRRRDRQQQQCENNNYNSISSTSANTNTNTTNTNTNTCTINNNDNNNNNNVEEEEESFVDNNDVDAVNVVRVTNIPSNLMLIEEEVNEDQFDEDDFWYDAELSDD